MILQERLATYNLTPAPEGVTFSRQIALPIQKRKYIPPRTKKGAPHAVYFTIPEVLPYLQELGLSHTGRYTLQKGGTETDPRDHYWILYLELERT